MKIFIDRDEVQEWLEPLDYETFWQETADIPGLVLEPKASCDAQIASGSVDEALFLRVLKHRVELHIACTQDLVPRTYEPDFAMQ